MVIRTVADRTRSPRYPSYPLPKAIEFAGRIYQGIHRSSVDSMTVLKLMGFAGRSGASATALGTVRQYGLIQGYADETRISELALSIFEPASPSEKIASLREAGSTPIVFRQLYERFSGSLPNSNEAMRAYLIRELGFSSKAADECIGAIRVTEAYISSFVTAEEVSEDLLSRSNSGEDKSLESDPLKTAFLHDSEEVQASSEIMSFKLSKECRVQMRFDGELSQNALTTLLRYVELMRDSLSE